MGKLYIPSTKSDVLKCIEQSQHAESPSTYNCIILDGAAIVHSLSTAGAKTSSSMQMTSSFLTCLSKNVLPQGWMLCGILIFLKEFTRDKKGKGVHRKVSGGWTSCVMKRKKRNCFHFLHQKLLSLLAHKARAYTSLPGPYADSQKGGCTILIRVYESRWNVPFKMGPGACPPEFFLIFGALSFSLVQSETK